MLRGSIEQLASQLNDFIEANERALVNSPQHLNPSTGQQSPVDLPLTFSTPQHLQLLNISTSQLLNGSRPLF
jgi:hypothetical protein